MTKDHMAPVIVTGSREFPSMPLVFKTLDKWNPRLVIHGGCPTGADAFADEWARRKERDVHVYRARWSAEGNGAGPRRNRRMLEENPGFEVLAFLSGQAKGTRDCITKATLLGFKVYVYSDGAWGLVAEYDGGRLVSGVDVR